MFKILIDLWSKYFGFISKLLKQKSIKITYVGGILTIAIGIFLFQIKIDQSEAEQLISKVNEIIGSKIVKGIDLSKITIEDASKIPGVITFLKDNGYLKV